MDGPAVFKFAVNVMTQVAQRGARARTASTSSAVDWLIPHQANIRIIDATAKKLGVPPERVIATVERHANTSAASIPLALDEAVRDGRIRAGHRVLLIGVGGGFTWGSVLPHLLRSLTMQIAFVFPGQGSQSVGMMAGFDAHPAIRATFDEASEVLGQDLWALVTDGPGGRPQPDRQHAAR